MTREVAEYAYVSEGRPVAFLISGDQWAGAAVQVYNTILGLKRNGFDNVIVLVLNAGELKERIEALGVKVCLLDEGTLSTISLVKGLSNFLRLEKPRLLHVHEYKLQLLATIAVFIARYRGPVVRTVHSQLALPSGVDQMRMRLFQYLDRFIIRHFVAGVIAVSQEISESLIALSIKTYCLVIPNAINLPDLESGFDCDGIRGRFDIPAGITWIGCAIRLEPIKNPVVLLRMASLLKLKKLPFRLSIFGDGSLRRSLECEIERLQLGDCVMIHGHSTEVSKIMCCWDIFVLSSLHEGLPMSLLEAMSVNTVPVCTEVGGIPELVKNNHTGILVPSNNEHSLCAAMQLLISDMPTRTRLGNNAGQLIREKYNARDMARKYLDMYEVLLKK